MTLLILGLMFGYATGAFVSILIYLPSRTNPNRIFCGRLGVLAA